MHTFLKHVSLIAFFSKERQFFWKGCVWQRLQLRSSRLRQDLRHKPLSLLLSKSLLISQRNFQCLETEHTLNTGWWSIQCPFSRLTWIKRISMISTSFFVQTCEFGCTKFMFNEICLQELFSASWSDCSWLWRQMFFLFSCFPQLCPNVWCLYRLFRTPLATSCLSVRFQSINGFLLWDVHGLFFCDVYGLLSPALYCRPQIFPETTSPSKLAPAFKAVFPRAFAPLFTLGMKALATLSNKPCT